MRSFAVLAIAGASVASAQSYATSVSGASLIGPIGTATDSYVPYTNPATVYMDPVTSVSAASSSAAAPSSYASSVSGASLIGPVATDTASYMPYMYPSSSAVASGAAASAASGSSGSSGSAGMMPNATYTYAASNVATAGPAMYTGGAAKLGAGALGLAGAVAAALLA